MGHLSSFISRSDYLHYTLKQAYFPKMQYFHSNSNIFLHAFKKCVHCFTAQTALPILESHVKSILSFQDLHPHAMITLSFYHDLFIAHMTVLSEL